MSKTYALPRDREFKLNLFENGWLYGALIKTEDLFKRMEKECPIMYCQFQINLNRAYAESKGHPAQAQAKREVKKYQRKMLALQIEAGEIK